jgi:SNF2 family DNA or RNA helicase
MGLGKTATVLMLIKELGLQNVLIVAPLRVATGVWPVEAKLWTDFENMKIVPIVGTAEERLRALATPAQVHVINYDNIVWLIEQFEPGNFKRYDWPFTTVVCDESTRLKGYRLQQGTKRSAGLAKVAHRHVKRWINLTGTPSPNGLVDLWGQQWFVDGGRALGRSYSAFTMRWFYQTIPGRGFFNAISPLPHAHREIEAALRPTTLSIRAQDWFDITDPIVNEIRVQLPPQALAAYRKMERQFFAELEGGLVTAANAAVKTTKLLQFANGAVYHEDHSWSWVHDEKIEALRSIINEAAGANILVAYQYKSDAQRIKEAFPKAVEIRGAGAIEAWNAGKIPLLLAHPKSAGHGLNLQHGGNILVFFGHDWNLEEHLQIIERIGPARQRQSGYDRPVYVHHIIADGTIDDLVRQRRATKKSVMELLLESMTELV